MLRLAQPQQSQYRLGTTFQLLHALIDTQSEQLEQEHG